MTTISRRQFLSRALAGGASCATLASANIATAFGPGDTLRVAFVGIGNRGADLIKTFAAAGMVDLAAFCDVDLLGAHTAEMQKTFPDVPRFQDFRKMLAEAGDRFEAVVVAVPDHTHFAATMAAMAAGKHVYVEKPLAHTFDQVERLMAAAARRHVVTQMGNQGHSGNNYHQFKAWSEAGIIKDVTKIVMFMNSPRRWHGWKVDGFPAAEALPPGLDWDLWHANAPLHPFSRRLHPETWRGWYAYGNGAFGDWGPHILDTAHRFLALGLPRTIEAVGRDGANDWIFPQASTIRFEFAARGQMPPVEVVWYDGVDNFPPRPAEDRPTEPATPQLNGKYIFSKDVVFKGGTHGDTLRIIPEDRMQAMAKGLPPVTGRFSDHFENFVLACRGREPARSPFEVAGPLTQVFLLGVIAQRLGGRLEFDPVKKQFTNSTRANALLKGPPPRPGWESFYRM
ncbi:MAG: Gfo/Idh/MocA family protein [Bacteroidales bacterium]